MKSKNLNLKVWIAAALSISLSATAFAGEKGGNGGDPRVAEFLGGARYICSWLKETPGLSGYSFKCFEEADDLSKSVNTPGERARISFQSEEVKDSNGIPKDAVTLPDRRILVNIDRWQMSDFRQRLMTISMELSLLLKIPNRYDIAQLFSSSSPFGKSGPRLPLFNALPNGTRFVSTQDVVFPPNMQVIAFSRGQVIPTGWIGTASEFRSKIGDSGCFLVDYISSANYKIVSEFSIMYPSSENSGEYKITTPYSAGDKILGCYSVAKDPKGNDVYRTGTLGEFLDAMGNLFNVIFPAPDNF